MNAPAFPTNPTTGEFFGQWVWNGARWVCSPAAGVRVVTQVFRASGPYMPSQGLVSAVVECIGGGGGGGQCVGQATYLGSGGGGGSGGYSKITLAAALVAGGVQVTIGAGGAGGTTPSPNATVGQATTFGALCVANGGGLGGGVGTGAQGDGGAGGAAGVGDVAYPGPAGESGNILGTPGAGSFARSASGGTVFGGNGRGPNFGAGGILNGVAGAVNTGTGGGGGAYNETTTGANGGAGGSGICIVTEYCWADVAPDGDCNVVNVNARVAVTREPFPGPGPGVCPPGWTQVNYDGEG